MSSKNLDRLVENLQESPHSHPHEAVASSQQPDLFSFTVPTTFVELPSMGLFYPEDHPLYGEEAVEIKFMTAKEEDILTSQALIRMNLVIDRLIASLLVDKRIDPGSLLVGDRSAIILEARKTAYGTDYNIGLTCDNCGENLKYKFNLDLFLPKLVEYEESEEFFLNAQKRVVVKLPVSGAQVEIKMLTGADEKKILDEAAKNKNKGTNSVVTDQLRKIVHSVNGNNDYSLVYKFIQRMPAGDSRFLRKFYDRIRLDIDMKQEYVCDNCGNIADLEVPLSAEFFWPE